MHGQATYRVSPELLAREDFRAACTGRNFAEVFRLMRKWDGASQDRISSPVDGLTQSRVSRIIRGEDRIASLDVIERIIDALHIPGSYVGLAPRPWEAEGLRVRAGTVPAPARAGEVAARAQVAAAESGSRSVTATAARAGDVLDHGLTLDIEIADDGHARLTYRHELENRSDTPFTRLVRELWFEHTNGALQIDAVPTGDRGIIIQRIHDTQLSAKFACQIFPALQPGESATVSYTCTGGRFVYDHYWRQQIVRPTDELTIRLRHHGVDSLSRCAAIEERPDGSEVSATESLSWRRDDAGIAIELIRRDLRANQSVTLRWDTPRATT
ncbi:MAG: helix-turn-helix transcriptional regulator [Actinobacteria bacterium]|nr:helix-turn-helix transcriptional regulator [Actinomycetota bacterium]MBI3688321.1 helix-turn-helix transcriptional regulator [Actinomycetota bacterium]